MENFILKFKDFTLLISDTEESTTLDTLFAQVTIIIFLRNLLNYFNNCINVVTVSLHLFLTSNLDSLQV